ncbi:hypothetical protein [Roseateles sp.]|uniref:hypothetical protein n=1 Tax=Roseateles sp. TaxID=1971397 RepID=UPI00286B0C1C|nr:hypothetical protein [Roseateles sp.]
MKRTSAWRAWLASVMAAAFPTQAAAPRSAQAVSILNAQANDGSLRGDPAVAITASSLTGATAAPGEPVATDRLSIIVGYN